MDPSPPLLRFSLIALNIPPFFYITLSPPKRDRCNKSPKIKGGFVGLKNGGISDVIRANLRGGPCNLLYNFLCPHFKNII